ncbi:hypothetical protein PsYK624_049160 [Phanerochaete sordida]|uniref:3'-5' exonuclease domain-containing protein n=1 Tax=Phanerochaete sordida TaxID=48140 RepID=A0A9P3G6N8_9APHY|nr:hypothetical protein PsYK624_049160 [Phanerochaete sordida]
MPYDSNAPPQVTLCDDAAAAASALEALRRYSYIACDCEGLSLGEVGGSLSLVSLGGIPGLGGPTHIFLFDAPALGAAAFAPVLALLASPAHTKVLYDARMDWAELAHRHAARLAPVLDLQLADVQARAARGEGAQRQFARLAPFVPRGDTARDPAAFRDVHRLNGLAGAARDHGLPEGYKPKFDHTVWGRRPLSQGSLDYAAADIVLIAQLYGIFVAKGYIDEPRLLEQSARYMALNKDGLRGPRGGHSLLPLEILAAPPALEPTFPCGRCARALSAACFPRGRGPVGEQTVCWVCRAVAANAARREMTQRLYGDD